MKILIALPAFGYQNSSETTKSLVALTKELAERQIFGGLACHSFPDIVDLRNVLLSVWYEAVDATHMLFVDADMGFEPDHVKDMVLADKQLCGAIYPKKRFPITWVGSALDPAPQPEGNLLEVEGIGCGLMLIRKDCISNMLDAGQADIQTDLSGTALNSLLEPHGVKRLIRAFDKVVTEDGRHLSEDFSFCHRHRKAGGKVFACINHTISHYGVYPFSGKYSDLYASPVQP